MRAAPSPDPPCQTSNTRWGLLHHPHGRTPTCRRLAEVEPVKALLDKTLIGEPLTHGALTVVPVRAPAADAIIGPSKAEPTPAVGLGEEHRLVGQVLIGAVLIACERLVHLMAFPGVSHR